jgi:hypothetical protein
MRALISLLAKCLGLVALSGGLLSLGGCPRNRFALGDDTGDAGSQTAGHSDQAGSAGQPSEAGRGGTRGDVADAGAGSTRACGSRGLARCQPDEYCHYPVSARCGQTDAPGVCEAIPQPCTQAKSPVCGCDGKTYASACSAAAAGTSTSANEACPAEHPNDDAGTSTGSGCGGLRGAACSAGEYCNYALDAQCGASDQTGVCTRVPQLCTLEYNPVCGCDDKTYANPCGAASRGVSVASKGECPEADGGVAQSCGGRQAKPCSNGEYCDYPAGALCGRADATGSCAPKGSGACTKDLKPVCGCDGKTYNNLCLAASAGVSVETQGACAGSGQTCGGLLGKTCPSGQYCNFPIKTMCGSGDQTGSCDTIPQACADLHSPVCGCDGKTYSNSCFASIAGSSVRTTGACP